MTVQRLSFPMGADDDSPSPPPVGKVSLSAMAPRRRRMRLAQQKWIWPGTHLRLSSFMARLEERHSSSALIRVFRGQNFLQSFPDMLQFRIKLVL